MAKVKLSEIQNQLVKRGRDAYQNPELEAELMTLDPSDPDSAISFEEAQFTGDPDSDAYTNHKNLWRARVASCAERVLPEAELTIQWTRETHEMIVSFRK